MENGMSNIHLNSVINCMLAMQRYPWEQGVCAQALYEAGRDDLWIPMAYDSVKRMSPDGRLAMVAGDPAVSDPASCGEVCLRAYEKTGDTFFLGGAEQMLDYLMTKAPRTADGIICHNNISFEEGFSPFQLWIDGLYMVPPFLAVMGRLEEAIVQIRGYIKHLYQPKDKLFYHIIDAEQNRFVRKKFWATGNGWALLGLARVIEEAQFRKKNALSEELQVLFHDLLDGMLKYQLEDGRFRDTLDDETSFVDGTSAMMVSAAIYRGIANGYLATDYRTKADPACETVSGKIDAMGLLHEVCGCPHFVAEGTSAEAQAAYIMAMSWKRNAEEV